MASYKLKDDFVNGVLPNTNGKPNIIFKKGDIIDGIITEKFVFNTMMKGIMSKPTVVGARVEEAGGLVFVPITSIDLVNQSVVNANEVTCADGTKDISNGKMPPCTKNGGIKQNVPLQEPVSDFDYFTSSKFLKKASVSIVPVGLIGAYCYHKKFSLLKSALLVSIPIVAITGLQYVFMGGGKNKYWGIFVPPSIQAKTMKQIQLQP
jgi:hypothetical protein